MRLKQYDDAVKYLEMSLEINRGRNDARNIALNLTNLGGVCLETDELDKALEYYKQAYQIYKTIGPELLEIGDIYNNIAEVYEQQHQYTKALENLFKAYKLYQKQNYLQGITMTLVNMGNIYTAQGRYEEAEAVLDSSLRVAIRAESRANQKNILWAMANNYYKAGSYQKAYEYYDQYQEIYKELFEVERTAKINELNIKYNNERIARENLALKNDNLEIQLHLKKKSLQSTIFMFTLIGVVLLALLISLYSRHRISVSRNKIRQLEEEKKFIGARLLLEAQEQERKRIALELHDGLGVLLSATRIQFSNLKDKSPENKQLIEKASQLLEQATGDVRKISHNMMPGLLTKLGLYEAVEDLFENLDETEGLRAVCEISGNLKRLPENMEIMLYRIIQEWVNNTLKHAHANNIGMKIREADNHIHVEYRDDGMGFEPEKALFSDAESLGLKSIRSRVDFLNGKLDIESAPGKGVLYKLVVPVRMT
jgi:signal transduction histidine kinase